MAESYKTLGRWFEYLNADCDYDSWSQYLLSKLKSADVGSSGIDIGCGNGYFTRALNRAGYSVSGMDISPEMLTVARQKAAKEGIRCEFLLGDITKLKLCGKVNFAVAVNDCINYVPPSKLGHTFRKVYSCLTGDGVFFFDISSENKLRNIIGENLFGEDGEDISYLWFNRQTPEGVRMELTFFVKRQDGAYDRFEETHFQYAHGEETIVGLLKEAGFVRVETEGHLGGDKTERINFFAYKR